MLSLAFDLTACPFFTSLISMAYRIGRILQIAGMIILPQAIVLELLGKLSLGQSLLLALGGIGVFMVGVGIQKSGGR